MQKQTKPKAQLIFLLLSIFVIMISISSVSAASTVYVNTTGGNDSNTGTIDNPYQTIAQGINSVDENGTVYIADGVYNGTNNTNITLSKSMNITGQSQTGTIINGTGTNWIFNIQQGISVNLYNLTLTNGYTTDLGGAIYNQGNLTVTNCTFTNNEANYGGAICNLNRHTVMNCNITESTFINNEANYGGAICNLIANGISMNCNITESTFINNHADEAGGAICNALEIGNPMTCNANFNLFYNNTATSGNTLLNAAGSLNADNNWWGSNNPIWADLIRGNVDHSAWLYMRINTTPTTINNTQSILVTASFNNRYDGTTVTSFDPITGHLPDGTIVTYSSALGSFSPVTAKTVNGIATSLFTANQTGTGDLTATTDNQTLTQLLAVNPASYLYLNVTNSNSNPIVGETFILTYKLSNSGPDNATNVTRSFQIPSGLEFVTASVDNGTWTYNPTNRTVTWTLTNVTVGDPYLYLTVKALGSGSYTITQTMTSETYNRNTYPLAPFTVNVQAQNNANVSNGNNTTNTVNAATQTIAMQHTGAPLAGLALAILAIFSGMLPRRKQ